MTLFKNVNAWITLLATLGIMSELALHLIVPGSRRMQDALLIGVVIVGGAPMLMNICRKFVHGEFGADALAAVSIVTAFLLKEYLAASIIVIMLSGGALLESQAVRHASSVLNALLKRMPKMAHRKEGAAIAAVAVEDISIGDRLVIFPHDIVPVDGIVSEGRGSMDESYLTGEPFLMSKVPGSYVLSGAINGESVITIEATKRAQDSRYAQITSVMRAAEEKRPRLRRLADRLSAFYTPAVLVIAGAGWFVTGDPNRFLAVVVVATPCPLIIAIPIAIIGGISLAAKRGIIIKNPIAMERIQECRTAIYDKTGTLTYGQAVLAEQDLQPAFSGPDVLQLAASLERYSKHPLAKAVREAAAQAGLPFVEGTDMQEKPGHGLQGHIAGRNVQIVGRKQVASLNGSSPAALDSQDTGLECFVLIDGQLAARYRFRDSPRAESPAFIQHLMPRHSFDRQLIISGDRESEVRYLAAAVGIQTVYAGKSPEEKLALVRDETHKAKTLYIGDGINDAPALLASSVGVAVGQNSDITGEAASVVVLDGSLRRVDEFIHLSERVRSVALQCAIGGMLVSGAGMIVALVGLLTPVAGAVFQEIIDLVAIGNALRAARPPKTLADI